MAGASLKASSRVIKPIARKPRKSRKSKKSTKSQGNVFMDLLKHMQKYLNIIIPKQARKYIRVEFVIVAAVLLYFNRNAIMGVRKFKR